MRGVTHRHLLPFLVWGLICGADLIGLFDAFKVRLVEGLQRFAPTTENSVVIVEQAGPTALSPSDWSTLVSALLSAGAGQIVFAFDPFGAAPLPAAAPTLIVGAVAERSRDGEWRLQDPARPARSVAVIAPAELGAHRSQLRSVTIGGRDIPTIEAAAVPAAVPDKFLIDFSSAASLPRLSAERVLSGQLVNGMLRGKTVVVGPTEKIGESRLFTPLSPDFATARPVDLHAAAIQTLQQSEAVTVPSSLVNAIVLLAVCLLAAPLYARVRPKRAAWLVAAVLGVALGLGVAVLWVFEMLLPAGQVAAAQLLLAPLIVQNQQVSRDAKLASFIRRAGARIESGRSETKENWASFAAGTARMLGINRQLLLRRGADGTLEQLAAVGMSVSDLPPDDEARRTLLRKADTGGRSLALDQPDVAVTGAQHGIRIAALAPDEDGGGYYLYDKPLPATVGSADPGAAIDALLIRLSELMSATSTATDKTGNGASRLQEQVVQTVERMERRQATLAAALSAVSSGVALFDAAGLLLHINARMESIMRGIDLEPGRTTMVDLVSTLAGVETPQALQILRHVVLMRASVTQPVIREIDGRRFMLRIDGSQSAAQGGTGALVCELVDVTEMSRLAAVQRDLAGYIDTQLRNDFESVQLAVRLATDPRLPDERRSVVIDRLNVATKRAREKLGLINSLLSSAPTGDPHDSYPIDPLVPVRAAVAAVLADASRVGVNVTAQLPSLAAPVIAEPEALRELVVAILTLVVSDSVNASTVIVQMHEMLDQTKISIQGGSFGLPKERLMAMVDGNSTPGTQVSGVAAGSRSLQSWGGSLTVNDSLDDGYEFTIVLQKLA